MKLVPCKLSALATQLRADIVINYEGTTVAFAKPGSIRARVSKKQITDITDVSLETGADVGRRITATRLATLGAFALAAKKRTGSLFLTVSGTTDGQDWDEIVEISPKHEAKAREFALLLSRTANAS